MAVEPKILNIKTVEELKDHFPFNGSMISKWRAKKPGAPLFTLLDTSTGVTVLEKGYRLLHPDTGCICGKNRVFLGLKKGYSKFCSKSCLKSDTEYQQSLAKKRKATMIARYGVTGTLANPDLRRKVENTMMHKYGATVPSKSVELLKKIHHTNLKRYGGISPATNPSIAKKGAKTRLRNEFIAKKESIQSEFEILEWEDTHSIATLRCKTCNAEFSHVWDTVQRSPICRACNPQLKGTSKFEDEICSWLQSLGVKFEKNVRLYQKNSKSFFEIDILTANKLGIEFNGLYWHSEEAGRGRMYHADKLRMAAEHGIQLIQIFEHEWVNKTDICKSIISSKLGITKKVFARTLDIAQISKERARSFFEENHISGYAKIDSAVALLRGTELLAVAGWARSRYTKSKSEQELIRFCTAKNTTVVGGLSRLTVYQSKLSKTQLISYCDLRWGTGRGYEKSGWELASTTLPGFWYFTLRPIQVWHRSVFQKKKLSRLVGRNDLSEAALAKIYGLSKFWDCGSKKFIYNPK